MPGDKDGDGGIDGFSYRGCFLAEGSDPFSEIIVDGAMTTEVITPRLLTLLVLQSRYGGSPV